MEVVNLSSGRQFPISNIAFVLLSDLIFVIQ